MWWLYSLQPKQPFWYCAGLLPIIFIQRHCVPASLCLARVSFTCAPVAILRNTGFQHQTGKWIILYFISTVYIQSHVFMAYMDPEYCYKWEKIWLTHNTFKHSLLNVSLITLQKCFKPTLALCRVQKNHSVSGLEKIHIPTCFFDFIFIFSHVFFEIALHNSVHTQCYITTDIVLSLA